MYICCPLITKLYVLFVEIQFHFHGDAFHDILDQMLSEGDAVEVLHIVKLLDDFKVG